MPAPVNRVGLAVLVLALAAALLFVLRGRIGDSSAGLVDHARLQAEAAALAARHPDVLGDFRVLPRIELFSTDGPTIRAGKPYVLLAPAGNILEMRPEFRWETAGETGPVEIRVMRADGTPVWSGRADGPALRPADGPPLVPGSRYLWRVVGPRGRGARLAQSFRLASHELRARYAAGVRLIRASQSAAAGLLIAHLAIRLDFPEEAEREVRAFLTRQPANPAALDTLRFLLDRLGSRAAESVDARW